MARKTAARRSAGVDAPGESAYNFSIDLYWDFPMTDPVIAQKTPYVLTLPPGVYWWCACGRSQTQPFCDGSHKGTGLEPVKLELNEAKQVYLCGCKHSRTKPLCDGSHKTL